MSKKNRIDLERLANITNTEKDLLKGLYGDMFGTSSGSSESGKSSTRPKKESVRDRFASKEPTAAELLDRAYQKHKDPLEEAKRALK